MIEISCREVIRELSNYIDPEIGSALRREIEEHLLHCRHCSAVYDGVRNVIRLVGERRTFELPAGFRQRLREKLETAQRPTRIVILGGGFGGLYVALELEKGLARDPRTEITLVNRENFFLFTPMLHEVAASDLDVTNIVNPVRKLLRRVNFFAGDVERIDLEHKTVQVSHGFDHHHHEMPYDHLVISLGSITNFYNLPGLAQRALIMKSLGDAIHLRNRLIAHLKEADPECSAGTREPLMTFVVAGGGFAGVETIAGINDFIRHALRFYPNLKESHLRMVLVPPGPVILPELGEKLGSYAQKRLSKRGVEIRVNTKVSGVSEDGVQLDDGSLLRAKTLIWTAGTSSNPLLASLPCLKEHGRVLVDETLEVPGWPGVWALGDCALVPDIRTGKHCPPTAQHALRQGRVLARNITASLRGGTKKKFSFATLGQLAAIGRRTGVANILGLNFSGFLAWWLWRTIYLSKLPRFEKKLRVALDWTLDLAFSKDLVQFLTIRAPVMSGEEEGQQVDSDTGTAGRASRKMTGFGHDTAKSWSTVHDLAAGCSELVAPCPPSAAQLCLPSDANHVSLAEAERDSPPVARKSRHCGDGQDTAEWSG